MATLYLITKICCILVLIAFTAKVIYVLGPVFLNAVKQKNKYKALGYGLPMFSLLFTVLYVLITGYNI